ncbi:unnamed protein product [Pieris macdunnoughi]|uniref:Uncharacterized protein n=1 Tax=Pieris macdunnoughi TaxID=345717 RepID=A0A821M756_9NEOP|nr:unnamed protein product [Pieris macdunnoughi]
MRKLLLSLISNYHPNSFLESPQAAIQQRCEITGAQTQARVARCSHPPAQSGTARADALQTQLGHTPSPLIEQGVISLVLPRSK